MIRPTHLPDIECWQWRVCETSLIHDIVIHYVLTIVQVHSRDTVIAVQKHHGFCQTHDITSQWEFLSNMLGSHATPRDTNSPVYIPMCVDEEPIWPAATIMILTSQWFNVLQILSHLYREWASVKDIILMVLYVPYMVSHDKGRMLILVIPSFFVHSLDFIMTQWYAYDQISCPSVGSRACLYQSLLHEHINPLLRIHDGISATVSWNDTCHGKRISMMLFDVIQVILFLFQGTISHPLKMKTQTTWWSCFSDAMRVFRHVLLDIGVMLFSFEIDMEPSWFDEITTQSSIILSYKTIIIVQTSRIYRFMNSNLCLMLSSVIRHVLFDINVELSCFDNIITESSIILSWKMMAVVQTSRIRRFMNSRLSIWCFARAIFLICIEF